MIILPKSYSTVVSTQFVDEMERFVETLAETNYEDAPEVIEQFCQNNQAMVMLTDSGENIPYGSVPEGSIEEGKTLTYTATTTFKDRTAGYRRNICFRPTGRGFFMGSREKRKEDSKGPEDHKL